MPSEDIGPLLTGVLFADLALLLTVFLAVADDGDTPIVVLITDSNPGDAVCYGSDYGLVRLYAARLTVVPVVSVFSVTTL